MSKFPRDSGGQPENTNALKHGGAAATVAIRRGEPLTGRAREAELAVYEELETQGRYSLVKRNAARLQAACDLYWGAVSKAAESGDLQKLDTYIARFGWLAGASLRAWAQVKEDEKDNDDVVILDAIEAAGDDPEALDLIDQAVIGKPGRPEIIESKQTKMSKTKHDNIMDYAVTSEPLAGGGEL